MAQLVDYMLDKMSFELGNADVVEDSVGGDGDGDNGYLMKVDSFVDADSRVQCCKL